MKWLIILFAACLLFACTKTDDGAYCWKCTIRQDEPATGWDTSYMIRQCDMTVGQVAKQKRDLENTPATRNGNDPLYQHIDCVQD